MSTIRFRVECSDCGKLMGCIAEKNVKDGLDRVIELPAVSKRMSFPCEECKLVAEVELKLGREPTEEEAAGFLE